MRRQIAIQEEREREEREQARLERERRQLQADFERDLAAKQKKEKGKSYFHNQTAVQKSNLEVVEKAETTVKKRTKIKQRRLDREY